jgi:hypothetical protein
MKIFNQAYKAVTGGLLLLCVVSFAIRAFAQEPYPPQEPYSARGPFYGMAGHFSLDLSTKFMERDVTENAFIFGTTPIDKTHASPTSARLLAKLAMDITSNFQIYGLIGGSTLRVDEFDNYNADLGFAYGGGFKISAYPETFHAPVKLFLDFNFLQFKTDDTIFFGPAGESVNETIRWTEYVAKFGISGRHDFFEPYGGVRISFVRGKDHIPTSTQTLDLNFSEDIPVGLFAGTDIYLDRRGQTALYVEANIIDENSIAAGVKVRF